MKSTVSTDMLYKNEIKSADKLKAEKTKIKDFLGRNLLRSFSHYKWKRKIDKWFRVIYLDDEAIPNGHEKIIHEGKGMGV